MKYAMLVLKNLTRSKRRTILTVLSIAVSLFIFSALISMPAVVNQFLADSASSTRVAVHNKAGVTYGIPEAYKQRVVATPHVVAATAQSWFGGIYHEVSDQFPNMSVDPEMVGETWPDWDISPQALHDFQRVRTSALVGRETMKRFGFHVGQQIMLRGTIYPFNVTLDIVGVLGGKAPPSFVIFRRDYLEEVRGRPGFVDVIWVKVDNSANIPQVSSSLDEGFANSSSETLTEPEAAFYGADGNRCRLHYRAGRGQHHGDVDPRAAHRDSGTAIDRISRAHDPVDAPGGIADYRARRRIAGMRRRLHTAQAGQRAGRGWNDPDAGAGALCGAGSRSADRPAKRARAGRGRGKAQYRRRYPGGCVRWRSRSNTTCAACSCGVFPPS